MELNNEVQNNGFQEEEISLGDIIDVILRRLKTIIVVTVFVTVIAVVISYLSTPVYEASSMVKLAIKETSVSVLPEISPTARSVDPVQSQIEIIKSKTIARNVVAKYGINLRFPEGVKVDSTWSAIAPETGEYRVKFIGNDQFVVYSSDNKKIGTGKIGEVFSTDGIRFRIVGFSKKFLKKHPDSFTFSVLLPYRVAQGFSHRIKVMQKGKTDLAIIRMRSTSPKKAADLANAVAEEYVRYTLYLGKEDALKTKEFIEEQLKKVEAELRKSENELKDFKEKTGIFLLDETAKNLISNISSLEAEKSDVETQIASLKIQLENLRRQANSSRGEYGKYKRIASLPELSSNPYIQELKSKLTELELERAKLLEEYTESHPDVVQVERQIEATREQLREAIGKIVKEGPSVADPIFQKIVGGIIESQTQISALEGKLKALNRLIEEEDRKLKGLPGHEVRLAELQRKVDAGRAVYSMLLSKLEEARIAAAKQTSDAKIIDPAYPPVSPVKPRKRLNIILGVILGLMLGLGLAFVEEYMDTSVRGPEEVESVLGVPVIGSVPEMGGKDVRERLVTQYDAMSPTAEAFKGIRTNIRFSGAGEEVRVILVTSSGAGEGKTTVASNLGIVMAQMGKRVLLVDGDLRRPMVHKIFGMEREPGLTEVIVGEAELGVVIRGSEVEGLDVLVSGHIPPNPSELLGSVRMRRVIEEMRGRYEYVVIDSAPLMPVTDTMELSPVVDGVIMVVRDGITDREVLKRAVEQLRRFGGRLIGVVYNGINLRKRYYYYKYGKYGKYRYYHYYHYYYGDGHKKKSSLWEKLLNVFRRRKK